MPPIKNEPSLKQREMLNAYWQDRAERDVKYKENHKGYWYSSFNDRVVPIKEKEGRMRNDRT